MFKSNYVAKFPDAQGDIHYDESENGVWHDLFCRQRSIVKDLACDTFLEGLDIIQFPENRVPQLKEINAALGRATGWGVHPVAAIIPADEFFTLLAQRKFPAANFIRRREDFDYITEPDIFHEYFGHLPMLTDPTYADFMAKYGEMALKASEMERHYLARLYWFTVEFGLINTPAGMRNYGGGILSSPSETVYAIRSDVPERRPLSNVLETLRTPYRIDILQPIYYVIDSFSALYKLLNPELLDLIHEAHQLGDYPPAYPPLDETQHDIVC